MHAVPFLGKASRPATYLHADDPLQFRKTVAFFFIPSLFGTGPGHASTCCTPKSSSTASRRSGRVPGSRIRMGTRHGGLTALFAAYMYGAASRPWYSPLLVPLFAMTCRCYSRPSLLLHTSLLSTLSCRNPHAIVSMAFPSCTIFSPPRQTTSGTFHFPALDSSARVAEL